jgi:hypothetical protein
VRGCGNNEVCNSSCKREAVLCGVNVSIQKTCETLCDPSGSEVGSYCSSYNFLTNGQCGGTCLCASVCQNCVCGMLTKPGTSTCPSTVTAGTSETIAGL